MNLVLEGMKEMNEQELMMVDGGTVKEALAYVAVALVVAFAPVSTPVSVALTLTAITVTALKTAEKK